MTNQFIRPLATLLFVCSYASGALRGSFSSAGIQNEDLSNEHRRTGETHCGCAECGDAIWNMLAGGHTCGDRINWLQKTYSEIYGEEEAACAVVAGEFPDICGLACDPSKCAPPPPPPPPPTNCGCRDCTDEIWNTKAEGHTCGARITWVQNAYGFPESRACRLVAGDEFPNICGSACDPARCDQGATSSPTITPRPTVAPPTPPTTPVIKPTNNPTLAPSKSPTQTPTETPTEKTTQTPTEKPTQTPTEKPTLLPTGKPTPVPTESSTLLPTKEPTSMPVDGPSISHCGCEDCTSNFWDADAGGYTCGDRIIWVKANSNQSEEEACAKVAGSEFRNTCGPACDPARCDGRQPAPAPTLSPESSMYCFPAYQDRTRYDNVWGKYTVEVKEGFCGPSTNTFSTNTVSVDNDELTLEFKKVGNIWEASEVRVILPDNEMPFPYGTYSFSIKSVSVLDASSTVISQVLPDNLILGLFTWDTTESYAIRENYNHEVDIEISRWNDPGAPDVQFLVQPYDDPNNPYPRSYSGATGNTYDQGGHVYDFLWNPGKVSWATDAGSGLNHSISTEDFVQNGNIDYVQCLPADVEVRMNLWNGDGNIAPSGLSDTERVAVVIDNFAFTPSGESFVAEGEYCSKHCQCSNDESVACVEGRCLVK